MITRRDAAQRLDIPLEMATRHGIPPTLTAAQLAEIEDKDAVAQKLETLVIRTLRRSDGRMGKRPEQKLGALELVSELGCEGLEIGRYSHSIALKKRSGRQVQK